MNPSSRPRAASFCLRASKIAARAGRMAGWLFLIGAGFLIADVSIEDSFYSWRLLVFGGAFAAAGLAACVWLVAWLLARRGFGSR